MAVPDKALLGLKNFKQADTAAALSQFGVNGGVDPQRSDNEYATDQAVGLRTKCKKIMQNLLMERQQGSEIMMHTLIFPLSQVCRARARTR